MSDWMTAPDGLPVAFHEFREEDFPFCIITFGPEHEIVWAAIVTGPGVLPIAGTGPGSVTRVICVYGDGAVIDHRLGS